MVIEHHWIAWKRWCIRGKESRFDKNRGIVYQNSAITVIRMIVISPVNHDDISLPLSDLPRHFPAVLERRHQLTIVDIHHFSRYPKHFGSCLHLCHATYGQGSARSEERRVGKEGRCRRRGEPHGRS